MIQQKSRLVSRRRFIQWTGGVSAAAFLAACAPATAPTTGGDASAPAADAPAAAEDGYTGGTMVWLGHQEVSGLSPSDAGPTVHWAMISNIHNAMLQVDINGELIPVLAESYEVAEDGLTYTFTLKQGIKFHDGKELTAADVKYTFEFYRDATNGSTLANNYFNMGEIETPDDYTVVVHMLDVNAAFLMNASTSWIVQSEYHAEVGEDVYRTQPIGTGQFKLAEWVPAEYTLLEAFPDHFRGRPKVDFLRQNTVPEPSVRAIALETGEADGVTWPLLVEDSLRLRDEEGYPVFATLASSVKHFPLNNKHPILSEKLVRQALITAIDRQRIIDELWNGAAEVAHANLSPANSFYFKADVKKYEYDPEAAKALLEEAGWTEGADGIREKDGQKLTFTCHTITGDQARRPIAELTQQFFKEVGVDMQLAEAPVAAINEALKAAEMDASLYNWTFGSALEPDASATLKTGGGNNYTNFSNARVDELLELGLMTVDLEERQAIYYEIQDIVAEEVPFLFLQWDQWLNVWHPRVTDLPDPATTLRGDMLFPYGNTMGINQNG
ncbi:MAG: ABC transporter substrate-binding protein [Caldilineaceae bacterium]|nr:ABC transporter substrate-binding protein [Caldilineaceae bacterium]